MEYTIETKLLVALLEFASKDATRPHLSGLGVAESGFVCCTDGHTLARYRDAREGKLRAHAQRVWPRAYLDEQIAVAKARKLAEGVLTQISATRRRIKLSHASGGSSRLSKSGLTRLTSPAWRS